MATSTTKPTCYNNNSAQNAPRALFRSSPPLSVDHLKFKVSPPQVQRPLFHHFYTLFFPPFPSPSNKIIFRSEWFMEIQILMDAPRPSSFFPTSSDSCSWLHTQLTKSAMNNGGRDEEERTGSWRANCQLLWHTSWKYCHHHWSPYIRGLAWSVGRWRNRWGKVHP